MRREEASVSINSRGNAAPQVLLLRFKKRTLDSGHSRHVRISLFDMKAIEIVQ